MTTSVPDMGAVGADIKARLDKAAPLASPALTGTPTAPTASAGTSSTQLATTAFVQTAVNGKIATTGARGSLAGYESMVAGSTVSATSGDAQTGSSITISNGSSGTSWTKIVGLSANATVTLGSSWSWSGGEAPEINSAGILVCCWVGNMGICVFVTGS